MKKIISGILLVSALILTSGVTLAVTPKVYGNKLQSDFQQCLISSDKCVQNLLQDILTKLGANLSGLITSDQLLPINGMPQNSIVKPPVEQPVAQYTDEQKTCIKSAQTKRAAAIKSAQDALNVAIKDVMKIRQDAVKVAQSIFDTATATALKTKQDAIKVAQAIKDPKARAEAVKAAQDAYNNNATVKAAGIPLEAAKKAAQDLYNNDSNVQQAKPLYAAAVKAANDQFQAEQKVCIGGVAPKTNKGFFKRIGDSFSSFGAKMMEVFSWKK